jgi:ATP-dependent exoDNAse (exonuclease V) beta subunit
MLRAGQDGPNEIAEERRLLYVAMTRAQGFLVSVCRPIAFFSDDLEQTFTTFCLAVRHPHSATDGRRHDDGS